MLAWLVKIGPHSFIYQPHTVIKAHALIDFIVECSFSSASEGIGEGVTSHLNDSSIIDSLNIPK